MPKIEKISISLFMFALESYLLEKKVIQNIQDIKQLDWEIVENYRNILLIDHPHFTLEKKQLKSFIRHYKDRRKELETRKLPMDLEPVKQLMREYDAAPAPSTVAPHKQLMSEIADMRSQLMSEIADMRSQLMSEMRELRSECVEMRSTTKRPSAGGAPDFAQVQRTSFVGLLAPRPKGVKAVWAEPTQGQPGAAHQLVCKHKAVEDRPKGDALRPSRPGASHQLEPQRASLDRSRPSLPDFKAILQSLDSFSPRVFTRARQRVALLVLYIEGIKVSQLLTLKVRHLKELRAPGSDLGLRPRLNVLAAELQELVEYLSKDFDLLIVDSSDNTPAFRPYTKSQRQSTREALTSELNQILSKWNCSTKSLASPRP